MELTAAIMAIESSEAFKGFSKEHPKRYFAHAFSMERPEDPFRWQLGYYVPDIKKLFVFKAEPVEALPADDAYGEVAITRLELKDIKVEPDDAKKVALGLKEQRFPAEQVTKVILILQNLDRPLYNFTLVTSTFNILNLRIDAMSGEVLSSEMRSIMSLRRDEH
jgi:hypothetical protein